MAELENLITRLIHVLKIARIKYVIVGGFPAILRGNPRTTTDVDVIIEFDPTKIESLISAFKDNDFDVIEDQIEMGFKEGTNVSIFDNRSILRVDMKKAKSRDEFEVLTQAIDVTYQNIAIKIASNEQILYGKLLYLGDISDISDKELMSYSDVMDFIKVYQESDELNLDWLKKKCKERGLLESYYRLKNIAEKLED